MRPTPSRTALSSSLGRSDTRRPFTSSRGVAALVLRGSWPQTYRERVFLLAACLTHGRAISSSLGRRRNRSAGHSFFLAGGGLDEAAARHFLPVRHRSGSGWGFPLHLVTMASQAAITVAICMGKDVHLIRSRRWKVGLAYGGFWGLIAGLMIHGLKLARRRMRRR